MNTFNHLNFGKKEGEIITLVNSYQALRHEFSDTGRLEGEITSLTWFFINLNETKKLEKLKLENSSIFFTLFYSEKDTHLKLFLEVFNKKLSTSNSKIIKADTVLSPFNQSFFLIAVCDTKKNSNHFIYGSIDTYIENIHFRENSKAKYYTYLASISDIKTKSSEISQIYSFNINEQDQPNIEVLGLKVNQENIKSEDTNLRIRTNLIVGKNCFNNIFIPKENSNIYLIGYAGYSAYLNYEFDFEYLELNILKSREFLFKNKKISFIASDISDGLIKSIHNLIKSYPNLNYTLNHEKLLQYCRKFNSNISIDNILNGGDDYSMILICNEDIVVKDTCLLGKLCSVT